LKWDVIESSYGTLGPLSEGQTLRVGVPHKVTAPILLEYFPLLDHF
jgi:hypothetical protein